MLINAYPETPLSHIRKTETFLERSKGLLGCKVLEKGHGMLISPCNSIHTFLMKISIDVIFLNKNYHIVSMKQNVKPQRFSMSSSASSVLELMAGQIQLSDLKIGDKLSWEPQK